MELLRLRQQRRRHAAVAGASLPPSTLSRSPHSLCPAVQSCAALTSPAAGLTAAGFKQVWSKRRVPPLVARGLQGLDME